MSTLDLMRQYGHRIGHINVVQLYNGTFESYLHVKHGDPAWISTGHRVGRHPTMDGAILSSLRMAFVDAPAVKIELSAEDVL